MNSLEWNNRIDQLRQGKLTLPEPEENGLSQYAGSAIFELRQYIDALEHGYRAQAAALRLYRTRTSRGGSLGRLIDNQWSDEAALGYAMIALNGIGLTPPETAAALEAMQEAMRTVGRDEAEERHRAIREAEA